MCRRSELLLHLCRATYYMAVFLKGSSFTHTAPPQLIQALLGAATHLQSKMTHKLLLLHDALCTCGNYSMSCQE
jgi:hypothetical protein